MTTHEQFFVTDDLSFVYIRFMQKPPAAIHAC